MRFVIATLLLTLSAISVLTGILIKGPFDAANYHKVEFKDSSDYSYAIIPHDTLTAYPGEVKIQASGTNQIFYADAREQDIQDWVGDSNFVRLNLTPGSKKPDLTVINGFGGNASPEGSDMWRTSFKVKTKLEAPVAMYDDTAVLLASNGFGRAPSNIKLSWQVANLIDWPTILIYSGLVLLALAIIMNILAFRHIRKLRGPRRRIPKAPKAPQYRKRIRSELPKRGRRRATKKLAVIPAGLVTLSLLTSCTPSGNSAQAKSLEKVDVVVTAAQLQRIVRDVAGTVNAADKTKDEQELLTRAAGSVYETRKVQYFLQHKSKKIAALPEIIANPITIALPMSMPDASLGWQPRTLMVTTKSDDAKRAPQMLILQQATPRDNYKLWYLIDLIDDVPPVAGQDVGAISFDANDTYLATKLTSLPFKYGDLLNRGETSRFFPEFDLTADRFYAEISQTQADQKETLKKAKVAIRFVHSLGNPNIIGMLTKPSDTGEAGGLVALSILDTLVIKPQVRGSAVSVTKLEQKLLLDAPGSSTGLTIVYENQMLFFVPTSGSKEKIRLVGATQGLLSVKRLN